MCESSTTAEMRRDGATITTPAVGNVSFSERCYSTWVSTLTGFIA